MSPDDTASFAATAARGVGELGWVRVDHLNGNIRSVTAPELPVSHLTGRVGQDSFIYSVSVTRVSHFRMHRS